MPRRVLIVDDNEDAAFSLQVLLSMNGHEARAVYRAAEALTTAPTFRPEVALLDLGMPQMDGFELARCLRRVPGLADLLLVALTGHGRAVDRVRSAEAGFDVHLVKPVDLDALEALLASSND